MITLLLLLGVSQGKEVFDYCTPSNTTCWPTETQWNVLKDKVTVSKRTISQVKSTLHSPCKRP